MNSLNRCAGVIALVAIVIAIGGYFFPQQMAAALGAVGTRMPNGLCVGSTCSVTQNKLTVGNSGTALGVALAGTCTAATTELPLEATSTDAFTCSVSGAASGDKVFVSLPSDPGSTLGGLNISYTAASTDTITFGVQNNTGAATSSFPLATTSVQYWIIR